MGKSSATKREALRDEACELASIIVERWVLQKADAEDLLKQDIFAELDKLDAAEIAAEYMSNVLTKHDHPCNAANLVEYCLRSADADVNCTTDRTGSPQSLIITKTNGSYHKKLRVYHEDQQKLTAAKEAKKVLCPTN